MECQNRERLFEKYKKVFHSSLYHPRDKRTGLEYKSSPPVITFNLIGVLGNLIN